MLVYRVAGTHIPRGVADLRVTDWPFLTGLAAAAVLALVVAVSVFRRRGWAARAAAVIIAASLVLMNIAAAVNTYVDFDRTLGEVLDVVPPDEVPLSNLLRRTVVPAAGVVAPLVIPDPASRFAARAALIYVPPAWFHRPRPRLPVLVLLHGTPGGPDVWFGAGQATATADAWATTHRGVAPILVAPDINGALDADTECVDSPSGRAETALTVDLPRFVQSTFRTQPPGRAWAVAGLSEGGSCALMLALRHPDLFGTVGDYSGLAGPRTGDTNAETAPTVLALFGGSVTAFDAHEPSALLRARRYPALGAWFEVGDADPEPLAAQSALTPLADRAGLATCSVVVPGGTHTFDLFSAALADSLPWMAERMGIGARGATCPRN